MTIKIGFFGTPELSSAVLTACIEDLDIEVVFVVSQADKPVGRDLQVHASPVSVLAIKNNIPLYRPEKIRGNQEFLSSLQSHQVDFLVVVAYGKILPLEILQIPKILPINIHGSILPKYRGASPIQASLLAGEKTTGVTIMRMDEGMDEGGILLMEEILIDEAETAETLFRKFSEASPSALLRAIKSYFRGEITIVEQNHEQATYTKKIEKSDGRIDWNTWTGKQLYNSWQGYTPWPGVWTYIKGKRCTLTQCREADDTIRDLFPEKIIPGLLRSRGKEVFVQCADGTPVEIIEILIEGKPRRRAGDVLQSEDFFESYL